MIGIYCYRHALIHAVFVCSSYYYRWLNHYQCNMLKQLLFLSRPISNIMANILYALKNILIHHSNMESPFTNFFSLPDTSSVHAIITFLSNWYLKNNLFIESVLFLLKHHMWVWIVTTTLNVIIMNNNNIMLRKLFFDMRA